MTRPSAGDRPVVTSRSPFQHRLPGQSDPRAMPKSKRFVVRKDSPEETKRYQKHEEHATSPPNSNPNLRCERLPLHWPGSLTAWMRKAAEGVRKCSTSFAWYPGREEGPAERSLFWCSHLPKHCPRVSCYATNTWSDGCSRSGFFSHFLPTTYILEESLSPS